MITQEERERERALFSAERARVPEQFEREPMVDDARFLKMIGIELDSPEPKPVGYLRLMPQDFIVEEVDQKGQIHDVSVENAPGLLQGEGNTIFADLVKVGISTLTAKHELATTLGIDENGIGFAGIKDRIALTSQRISIRGLPDANALATLTPENFFLKNITRGKGVMANGELSGNRFTITLRSPDEITEEREKEIHKAAQDISDQGFWNFFSFQRFGTPRLLGHRLGRFIFQGDYRSAVKLFLFEQAERELPYFKKMRAEARGMDEDWARLQVFMNQFPYHFNIELSMLAHLEKNPTDFLGALLTVPDQVRLWIYAYDCYLYNRKLSELIKTGEVPFKLPLATSFNPKDWAPYQNYLDEDGVKMPSNSYKDFPFVRVASRTWPVLQSIEIHSIAIQGKLAVFSFTLPKGSYATTFLSHFFTLAAGLPVVPGISAEKIDAKEFLGEGTLAPTLERFKTVLEKREEDVGVVGEEG